MNSPSPQRKKAALAVLILTCLLAMAGVVAATMATALIVLFLKGGLVSPLVGIAGMGGLVLALLSHRALVGLAAIVDAE